MEFSLQFSHFAWLMSSINRIGKDRHRRGPKEEEKMKKRMLFSSHRPLYRHHFRHFLRAGPMFFCKSLDFLAIDWGDIQRDDFESILSTWSKHKVYSPEPSVLKHSEAG